MTDFRKDLSSNTRRGLYAGLGWLLLCSMATATISLDLGTRTGPGNGPPDVTEGIINDAKFLWGQTPGGSGNLQSVVRIAGKSGDTDNDPTTQEGYNTLGRPVPFSEMNTSATFTRDAQLGAVPIVTALNGVGGAGVPTQYYEFVLDINQNNSNNDSGISVDQIQIYTSPTPSQTTTNISSLGTLRYDLDASETVTPMPGNEILLDHKRVPGSGATDMIMLVPVSDFAGASATDYIYLYSSFGKSTTTTAGQPVGFYGTNAGDEEWAFFGDSVFAIPEPSNAAITALICWLTLFRRSRPGQQ